MKRHRKPSGRPERRDPLGHRPSPAAAPAGRPLRPSSSAQRRRRNRYRVPPVVAWNARLRWLRNVLFLGLLGELVWLGGTSPVFNVHSVSVVGSTARTPDEIRKTARLNRPMNVFRAPTRQAVRLLKVLPEVETVRVNRRLPDALAIVVTERTPLASVLTAEGCWVIDGTGHVFRAIPKPLDTVPVLMPRPTGPVVLGKPLPITALPAALESLKAVAKLPLTPNVQFHIEDNGDAWLRNANGLKIRLGQLDDAPQRLPLTERMLKGPNGPDLLTKLLVLDMTSPGNEFTKRRPEYKDFRFSGAQ